MDMTQVWTVLGSAPAISLYVIVAGYFFHRLAQAKQWQDERYAGLLHLAIMDANQMGLAPHEPAWLKAATDAFEKRFEDNHDVPPTEKDIADAAADIARTVGPLILPSVIQMITKAKTAAVAAPVAAPAPAPVAPSGS